ncbi:NYN domain-containing protein [Austwickia chelonae]|uniref:NYN domain-containing protein n=1 Tax=Austwickia chelonae TaxID=100225 RepID=UPI000E25991B|nr:NYN domain-containing protein [Austwickia chelonae]
MPASNDVTYLLIDGENIDATLGGGILGRRPRPEDRPRWDRVKRFAEEHWGQPSVPLFFLAVNGEIPMPFVQALIAVGYKPVPLSGQPDQKVVDIAIQRTLEVLRDRPADVMLVSHDGDFLSHVHDLNDGRRLAVLGFAEFRNAGFSALGPQVELIDLEYDVNAFTERLPRLRVIPIDEFDPEDFL